MKVRTVILMAALWMLAAACGNNEQSKKEAPAQTDSLTTVVQELGKACIEVHDEVMPRLGEIHQLKKRLSEHRVQLNDGSDSIDLYRQTIHLLDSADEAMMDWMAQYDVEYLSTHKPEEAVTYYEDQKEKVEYVKDLMLKSIEDGNQLLEKH